MKKIINLKASVITTYFVSTLGYGTLHTLGVGYDNLDNPQLVIRQTVECKGYSAPVLDSPYSHIMTVSPSINESYLKPMIEKYAP